MIQEEIGEYRNNLIIESIQETVIAQPIEILYDAHYPLITTKPENVIEQLKRGERRENIRLNIYNKTNILKWISFTLLVNKYIILY